MLEMITLEHLEWLLRVSRTQTEFDAACDRYRLEHGEEGLQAALDTIDELTNADIAEHNARLLGCP